MGFLGDLGDTVISAAKGAMATGSPWGAIGAGVLNYMGTQSTNDRTAETAASNNQWSAQQYATRYQTMVKDLQDAGLNPMLAYSQSPGSAPSAQQVQFQNPMSSATEAFSNIYGKREKSMADIASANSAYSQADMVDEAAKKIKQETENLVSDKERIEALTKSLKEQATLAYEQGLTQQQVRKQLIALVAKLKSETTLIDFDIKAAKDLDNIGRTSAQLKPIVDILRMFIRH